MDPFREGVVIMTTTFWGVSGAEAYETPLFSVQRDTPKGGNTPVNSPCTVSRRVANTPLLGPPMALHGVEAMYGEEGVSPYHPI
jgi:hypothetical protein